MDLGVSTITAGRDTLYVATLEMEPRKNYTLSPAWCLWSHGAESGGIFSGQIDSTEKT